MTLHVVPISVIDGTVDALIEVTGTGDSGDPAFTFFSGADGTAPWDAGESKALAMLALLEDIGNVCQVYWSPSWMSGTSGPKALGARPKAALDWIAANVAAEIRATGNSGGASELAYALAFHAGDVERAVYSGGPTHALLAAGCLGPGAFDDGERSNVDLSYGNTKCFDQDSSGKAAWNTADLITADGDFLHPDSSFVFGCGDDTEGPPHARAFIARLRAAGTSLQIKRLRFTSHVIQASGEGCSLIYDLLTA